MILCFDIVPEEYSFGQNLWCLCLFCFGLLTTIRYNLADRGVWLQPNRKATFFMVTTIFIMTITCFVDHDYYSYWDLVVNDQMDLTTFSLEDPYFYIIETVHNNYFLFRLLIWGCALFFFCKASNILNLSLAHTSFVLGACFMITFAYARASLAMAMVFFGYILFFQNIRKKFWPCLLGIAIFISGFYFHRSIVLAMVMILIMPFLKFKKSWIFFYIILIPIFFLAVRYYYNYLLLNSEILDEDTANKLIRYNEADHGRPNLLGIIANILNYGRFYVPIGLAIYALYLKNKVYLVPIIFRNLLKISVGITFVASCFLFFELDTSVFVYRFLYMAMIPLCFIIVEMYKKKVWTRGQYIFSILFGIIYSLYRFTYGLYSLN